MKTLALAMVAVAAFAVPAFAQVGQYGDGSPMSGRSAETRQMAPGYGATAEPRNGFGTADDNKQSATGGESGGSALRGR